MANDKLAEVLAVAEPSQIALIKSLLDCEKIQYVAQGEIHWYRRDASTGWCRAAKSIMGSMA